MDLMRNIDWFVSLDALELSGDQQKAILAYLQERGINRIENIHRKNLRLFDIKATLSSEVLGLMWVKESVDTIMDLHIEILEDYKLSYSKTWELLSFGQREKLLKLLLVAVRSQ